MKAGVDDWSQSLRGGDKSLDCSPHLARLSQLTGAAGVSGAAASYSVDAVYRLRPGMHIACVTRRRSARSL